MKVSDFYVDPDEKGGWNRGTRYYEHKFTGRRSDGESTWSFRCPVCKRPLREGLNAEDENHSDEEAGQGWPFPPALMCPKESCRAYFRLTETME